MKILTALAITFISTSTLASTIKPSSVEVNIQDMMSSLTKEDIKVINKMVRTKNQIEGYTWDKNTKHITVYSPLKPAETKCRPIQLVNKNFISDFYACEVEPNRWFLFDHINEDVE